MEKTDVKPGDHSLYDLVMNDGVQFEKIEAAVLETAMSTMTHSVGK